MAEAAAIAHQRRRKLSQEDFDEEYGGVEEDGGGWWRSNSARTALACADWSTAVQRLPKSRSLLDDPRRFDRYERTNTRDAAALGISYPRSRSDGVAVSRHRASSSSSSNSMASGPSLTRDRRNDSLRHAADGSQATGQGEVPHAAQPGRAAQSSGGFGLNTPVLDSASVPKAKAENPPTHLPSMRRLESIREHEHYEDQALVGGNRDADLGVEGGGHVAGLSKTMAVAAAGLCIGCATVPWEGLPIGVGSEPVAACDNPEDKEAAMQKLIHGLGLEAGSVDADSDHAVSGIHPVGLPVGHKRRGSGVSCSGLERTFDGVPESMDFCPQETRKFDNAGIGGGANFSAEASTRLSVPLEAGSLGGSESLEEEELRDMDEEVLQEVFWRVRKAKAQVENYCNVLAFFIFVAVYFAMLYLQADSTNGYEVAHGHESLLPPGFSADQPNSFNSREEFYTWLNDSVIQVYWKDPQCGNGVCESPLEYPAFGSQGCEADCGKMQNLSTILISINTNFDTEEARAASSWNLCMSSPVDLCWFSSYQQFANLVSHVSLSLEVPDGDWAVWINAPHGGVKGMVNSPLPGLSRMAVAGMQQMRLLTSWGQCMSDELSPIARCRGVSPPFAEHLWKSE